MYVHYDKAKHKMFVKSSLKSGINDDENHYIFTWIRVYPQKVETPKRTNITGVRSLIIANGVFLEDLRTSVHF